MDVNVDFEYSLIFVNNSSGVFVSHSFWYLSTSSTNISSSSSSETIEGFLSSKSREPVISSISAIEFNFLIFVSSFVLVFLSISSLFSKLYSDWLKFLLLILFFSLFSSSKLFKFELLSISSLIL